MNYPAAVTLSGRHLWSFTQFPVVAVSQARWCSGTAISQGRCQERELLGHRTRGTFYHVLPCALQWSDKFAYLSERVSVCYSLSSTWYSKRSTVCQLPPLIRHVFSDSLRLQWVRWVLGICELNICAFFLLIGDIGSKTL